MSGDSTRGAEFDPNDESGRYHRQGLIHWWDQARLARARVLVAGAGALGNEIVKNLVLVGVGRITVADLDLIEGSNLARCAFFREEDEGLPKAEVLARRAGELNPEVEVTPISGDIRAECGLGTFIDHDLVIGGLDNREARVYINQACWKTSTPWIDGAIEGLMGVVRVFIPPETACYECTMGEKDYELIAKRRACSLLSRGEMLEGKVPTTATTSSVVAAIEVQEAVKILHEDRLGGSTLAGAGFHFVGLTHDSYVVNYSQRDDCLAHDTYDLSDIRSIPRLGTFGETLRELGVPEQSVVELEREVALVAVCRACQSSEDLMKIVEKVPPGAGVCPECGEERQVEFSHLVEPGSRLLDRSPADLELPSDDLVTIRSESETLVARVDVE